MQFLVITDVGVLCYMSIFDNDMQMLMITE